MSKPFNLSDIDDGKEDDQSPQTSKHLDNIHLNSAAQIIGAREALLSDPTKLSELANNLTDVMDDYNQYTKSYMDVRRNVHAGGVEGMAGNETHRLNSIFQDSIAKLRSDRAFSSDFAKLADSFRTLRFVPLNVDYLSSPSMQSDIDAMHLDWSMVGEDFQVAIDKITSEIKEDG